MANAGLIAPKAENTPLSYGGSRKTKREIPDDLLKEASNRLAVMSLLGAVLWVVSSILWHLGAGAVGSGRLGLSPYEPADNFAVLGTLTSLALFLYARSTKREPQFILN